MKRVDLIKTIKGFGCAFVRHGGKHDWYRNPNTGVAQPVPRHREINERLAQRIIKMLSNPPEGQETADDGDCGQADEEEAN